MNSECSYNLPESLFSQETMRLDFKNIIPFNLVLGGTKQKCRQWVILKDVDNNYIWTSCRVESRLLSVQITSMTKYKEIKCPEVSLDNPCLEAYIRDFPGGPMAETPCSQCRGLDLIPSQGTRSLYATTKIWCSQINK